MANASATLLSWIAAEVDQALARVREQVARYSTGPGDAELLEPCPGHLHQVSGALRMVGLTGATRFCEAIESGFASPDGEPPSRAALGIIDRAIQALKDFMQGLEQGQANAPLKLWPFYRELTVMQGRLESSERDLFTPDLALRPPSHPQAKQLPKGEVSAYLQAQRALFQKGLLAWLRNQPDGLEQMRKAVDGFYRIAGQLPEPQAIWWVAAGLLDGLALSKDAQWLAQAKALGNRIDRQMREGLETVNEALLCDLLYAIATCKASSPLLKEIRQLYQFDSQSAEPAKPAGATLEFDLDWLEPALYDMHSRLDALKSAWVQYVAGEQKSTARFRELVAAFKAKAAPLGNQHLIKLLDAITLVTKHLPDPAPRQGQFMVIEMASAFLLVESVIDHFTGPPADLEQQIGIMGGWLLDAAMGKSTGELPAGLRADLSERIGTLQLRAKVAKEIAANLQHVEQVLDAFARDGTKRETLRALRGPLRQIHGALTVLRFDQAARALKLCEAMIAKCAEAGYAGAAEDMDWIAEGLSSIAYFLEPCRHGREPAEHAIDLFFRRHEKAHAPVQKLSLDTTVVLSAGAIKKAAAAQPKREPPAPPAPAAAPPAAAAAPPARPAVDAELLGIYLEEAEDVLRNIEVGLSQSRAQPQSLEVLTEIRRGFHTLKGSGRMVGLMDLGEVAWEVEQVMNHWTQKNWPASVELLEFAERARAAFAGWVAQLRDGKLTGEIDAADIHARAATLRAMERPGSLPAPPAAAAPAALDPIFSEVTAVPDLVAVGDVRLAPHMFEIYLKEAREHVEALENGYKAWRESPGEATREFVRAAHTLASSSITAGFASTASLAAALEQWMPLAPQSGEAKDAKVVRKAIEGLHNRLEAIARLEAPSPPGKVEAGLRALTARLIAQPVAAVSVVPSSPAPAPIPGVPAGRAPRVMRDDIDPQLLPIFLEEAQHLLPLVGSDLRDWKAHPQDEKVSQSLQRALHTLKGSARMAGAIRLGELTHLMESRIETALEAGAVTEALFADLEEKMDRLSLDLERMAAGPAPEAAAAPASQALAPAQASAPQAPAPAQAPRAEAPLPSPSAMLRINADTLDHLINESGEVAIARTRVEAELRGVKQSIVDLSESIARLRAQLREVEIQSDSQMQERKSELEERNRDFDPLEFDRYTRLQELTRLMAESLHDAASIQQSLSKNLGETDAALTHQARTSRDVQQELMRMRAVPFSVLDERLYRIVRQTTRELDKKAELLIEGSQVELDRSVLDRVGAPLEHILRNALAHGLESPAARAAAGKPPAGRLAVSLRQESNEIALVVSDDGAGLDLERLRRKAEEKGLLQPGQDVAEAELMQLIFVSGLSTAETVTELSGRGIGMDVVRNEIVAIGGRIDIVSERGRGTTFTIYLPLTLAVTQAVLVRAGGSVFAVSAATVEQVLRLKADILAERYAAQYVEFQDRRYPLHGLAQLLDLGAGAAQPYNSVLLLRSGVQRIALHVDEMLGQQEIVVKSIGPQLARAPGVAGATVLADGSIALIVNAVQLVQHARAPVERPAALPLAPAVSVPVIMVVDDSLTVRKITGRLLEREGYRVLTAKDGLDALAQMKDALPDVMLVDIEMPRMDGFDLTRNLRGDPRTRGIPIIIISSRTAEKHRSQAAELGVNVFLGKPYPEAELLQHIAGYVEGGRR